MDRGPVSHDKTVHALVPDRLGITVVDVDALVGYLEEGQRTRSRTRASIRWARTNWSG